MLILHSKQPISASTELQPGIRMCSTMPIVSPSSRRLAPVTARWAILGTIASLPAEPPLVGGEIRISVPRSQRRFVPLASVVCRGITDLSVAETVWWNSRTRRGLPNFRRTSIFLSLDQSNVLLRLPLDNEKSKTSPSQSRPLYQLDNITTKLLTQISTAETHLATNPTPTLNSPFILKADKLYLHLQP